MKISIKKKLILIFISLILILVGSSIVISKIYLGKYYILKNEQALEKVSKNIEKNLKYNKKELKKQMQEKYNIKLEIIKLNQIKKIEKNILEDNKKRRMDNFLKRLPKREIYLFLKEITKEEFEKLDNGKEIIKILEPNFAKNKFIILTRKLNENELLILSKALFPINQSVKIASDFFAMSSIFTIIIGTLLIIIFSSKITNPILKLNKITKKMTKFDFTEKSDIKSGDEIGELGKNINKLSFELEQKITELSLANRELKADIEKERQIEIKRKEFISNISHELKTPISIIGGYAEGLKDNVVDDEAGKIFYAETIIDETRTMGNLVKELLEFSKLDSDGEKLNIERFEIGPLIKEIVDKYKYLEEKMKIQFEINANKEKIWMEADQDKIKKVLNNYISNAIKNVNENGEIKIFIIQGNNKIRIEVENTGSFIPENKFKEIWTPFYKMDTSRNREKGGTGLGLAIVKSIIEKHKGRVGIENLKGKISFWFELKQVG